jgi:hypothetical protein
MKKTFLGTFILLVAAQFTWGSIIFDDFNTALGSQHFNQLNLNFSSTSSGITTDNTSSSTWDTAAGDGILEGTGMDLLHIIKNTSAGTLRVRWLSGVGTPANNTTFTTTGTGDGRIGLYVKAAAAVGTGWTVSFNLDAPANTTTSMSWSGDLNITADGTWHLYEWTIDSTTWGAVPGIGGQASGALTTGSHTIDSIYIRSPVASRAAGATFDFDVDFVAKTDADSISVATLIPEPSSIGLGLLGGFGLLAAWFRRR